MRHYVSRTFAESETTEIRQTVKNREIIIDCWLENTIQYYCHIYSLYYKYNISYLLKLLLLSALTILDCFCDEFKIKYKILYAVQYDVSMYT